MQYRGTELKNETEESSLGWRGSHGKDYDISSGGKDSSYSLTREDSSHVGRRKLASHSADATLEDGGVDVDNDYRGQGQVHKV